MFLFHFFESGYHWVALGSLVVVAEVVPSSFWIFGAGSEGVSGRLRFWEAGCLGTRSRMFFSQLVLVVGTVVPERMKPEEDVIIISGWVRPGRTW